MHAEPRLSSVQTSQQLAGHEVDVLETTGDWCRVRGIDRYEGWIHRGYLAFAPQPTARQSRRAIRMSLGCLARDPSGGRRALPLRALLAPDESVKGGEAIDSAQVAIRFPRDPVAITRTAQEFFEGTSYQWGGITPWGADCSGFVQSVFALHGVQLPRDAWQQAEAGEDGGRDIVASRSADLLFFSAQAGSFGGGDDGPHSIVHVGLALGARRMVHIAVGRGGFTIERLDDRGDPYMAALGDRFAFARRLV
jgi:hypothetical protein